jgi:hypothetical protein
VTTTTTTITTTTAMTTAVTTTTTAANLQFKRLQWKLISIHPTPPPPIPHKKFQKLFHSRTLCHASNQSKNYTLKSEYSALLYYSVSISPCKTVFDRFNRSLLYKKPNHSTSPQLPLWVSALYINPPWEWELQAYRFIPFLSYPIHLKYRKLEFQNLFYSTNQVKKYVFKLRHVWYLVSIQLCKKPSGWKNIAICVDVK